MAIHSTPLQGEDCKEAPRAAMATVSGTGNSQLDIGAQRFGPISETERWPLMTAHLAKLSEDLARIQELWKEAKRPDQDRIYAADFGPKFAPLFADLPLRGAPKELGRPVALISVLGLSWQPVALMASWARPKRMLLLGTEESLGISVGEEPVLKLISRISGIPLEKNTCQSVRLDRGVRSGAVAVLLSQTLMGIVLQASPGRSTSRLDRGREPPDGRHFPQRWECGSR